MANAFGTFAIERPYPKHPFLELVRADITFALPFALPRVFVEHNDGFDGCDNVGGTCGFPTAPSCASADISLIPDNRSMVSPAHIHGNVGNVCGERLLAIAVFI